MDDKRYLETIENDEDLPNGIYWAEWYKYDVTFKALGAIYTLTITKYQRTPSVPVTLQVIGQLIDVYLGHIKE